MYLLLDYIKRNIIKLLIISMCIPLGAAHAKSADEISYLSKPEAKTAFVVVNRRLVMITKRASKHADEYCGSHENTGFPVIDDYNIQYAYSIDQGMRFALFGVKGHAQKKFG